MGAELHRQPYAAALGGAAGRGGRGRRPRRAGSEPLLAAAVPQLRQPARGRFPHAPPGHRQPQRGGRRCGGRPLPGF